jgi:hypothetical protein
LQQAVVVVNVAALAGDRHALLVGGPLRPVEVQDGVRVRDLESIL